jgi:hypothetical protein
MQVRHALPAILPVVDDEPVTILRQSNLSCDLSGFQQKMPEQQLIVR